MLIYLIISSLTYIHGMARVNNPNVANFINAWSISEIWRSKNFAARYIALKKYRRIGMNAFSMMRGCS